ncbi:MAG: hypothetical protein MI748_00485 [Opitutales bacterium]|nr:hypothetical protein [Opitutales bacterium]
MTRWTAEVASIVKYPRIECIRNFLVVQVCDQIDFFSSDFQRNGKQE